MAIEFDLTQPVEQALLAVIKESQDGALAHVKVEKLPDGTFRIGKEDPFDTHFFMLNDNSEQNEAGDGAQTHDLPRLAGLKRGESSQDPVLCFSYGKGVLVFGEQFAIE